MTKYCRYCAADLPTSHFSTRRASPDGLAFKCRTCDKAYRLSRGAEVYKKLRRDNYLSNREHEKAKALEYYVDNRAEQLKRHAAYMRETEGQQREYRRKNSKMYVARVALRRAALSQRTPFWLTERDYAVMREMYLTCEKLEHLTGIKFQVDHVIPLRGKMVSGLHVPSNLQLLTAFQNLSKGNKYEPS